MHTPNAIAAAMLSMTLAAAVSAQGSTDDDRKAVAALDTEFQAAVKRHDVATIDRILHEDMILILGDGRVVTREDHLETAREREILYEVQDEDSGTQVVRVAGDTAVVTARLWIKGSQEGKQFDRKLWFSDTYVRTPKGWKYFFGQASLKLPDLP